MLKGRIYGPPPMPQQRFINVNLKEDLIKLLLQVKGFSKTFQVWTREFPTSLKPLFRHDNQHLLAYEGQISGLSYMLGVEAHELVLAYAKVHEKEALHNQYSTENMLVFLTRKDKIETILGDD